MRTQNLRWTSCLFVAAALAVGGCAKDDGEDDTAGDSTGAGSDSSASASASMSDTSATMSASSTTASTTEATTTATTGPSTVSVTDTDATTGTTPQPNGSMCASNDECESMMCFVVGPLGGICGDCLTDADCAATTGGGCSIPNPLATPAQGASCNMGEPGGGCMSDDVCTEGVCAVVLDVPGVLTASTCSECGSAADCMPDQLCSPTYDILNLSGENVCVDPGSVENGIGCTIGTDGDMACASGHCAVATALSVVMLGVCSECSDDSHCDAGETCQDAAIDLMMGLVPSMCVAM